MTTERKRRSRQSAEPGLAAGRRLLFWGLTLLIPVLFFALLEGALRIGGYGASYPLFHAVEAFPEYRVQSRGVARRYFHRTREAPTSLHDLFYSEKPDGELRLFVQGGSSAAGFPFYHGGAFSRMLEGRLRESLPDRPVTVINTAMAAVNSFTLLDLAPEILAEQPDAVLIYAGHNEFYGAFGVGSTETLGASRALVKAYLRLRDVRTVQLVRNGIAATASLAAPAAGTRPSGSLMARMVGKQSIPYGSSEYRRGVRQFERNLHDLLRAYRRAGVPVFVATLIFNERDHPPFITVFEEASVGGQGPELIFGPADNVGVLAVTHTVRPIDEVLPRTFLEGFSDDGIVGWEGRPLLVADQLGNHLALVYNKRFFDRAPETTEELVGMLRRITTGRGRDAVYGLAWNYREPFFFIPFLTGYGGWVMDDAGNPTLDNQATVNAIRFVLDLRDRYQVIPGEADYDVAETLFMEGRAAAIINGPWAWAGYERAGIDFGIAPLPRVSETGLWAAPMVAAKGYSVNVNVSDEKLPYVRDVLEYLTGEEIQREMAERLATIPTNLAVLESDVVRENPLLLASRAAMEKGRPMPVAPQMRQIWDGMRGPYQLVMNGAVSPEEGARRMQRDAEKRIADTFL